ncbi:MAG: DEAD/DEAH box helicase, partial [Myxococcales bacterium]|nr:DEAD/DEAH box helicase [Myxococcales bacterium]
RRATMGITPILSTLEQERRFLRNITAAKHFPGQAPQFRDFPELLHPNLRRALDRRGISQLYCHQRESWDRLRAGENLVITTPTASGKSLCYLLPVLDAICKDPSQRALLLFPTKALAQDQYAELHQLIAEIGVEIKTHPYDGDTPADARRMIRERGQIVISNPDMLHQAILPHHTKWSRMFANLRYVVLDELHVYRGVFGSHLANVLRRLRRICAFYGTEPQFICSSATIANPDDFAARMLEQPVSLVSKSGAPTGDRRIYFYNPPVVNKELGIRANYLKTSVRLATRFLLEKVPVIIFAKSRLNVEIMVKYLKDTFRKNHLDPGAIEGYRGGYLPDHRRRIERGLREGTVLGVVATNALELGIDIGSLTVCIIAGYPGSVASLWQQSGRAGRRNEASATFFVSRSTPLDQFIVQNPDYFFGQSPEHARINPDNLLIVADHLKCGAFELPFGETDAFGEIPPADTTTILEHLTRHRVLHRSGSQFHWMNESYPANEVSLRNIPGENFVVIDQDTRTIIAEVDYDSTPTTLYPHAIYQLSGTQYQVVRLDWENHKAYVQRVVPHYFTDAMTYTRVAILDVEESIPTGSVDAEWGEVTVTEKVVGFKKIRFYTSENVGFGDVNLPEQQMHTTAYWFTLSRALLAQLGVAWSDAIDGLMGVAHAMHYVAAMTLMCEVGDLGRTVGDREGRWSRPIRELTRGTLPADAEGESFDPTLFIFERYPGGVGFSAELQTLHRELLRSTDKLIRSCSCDDGCPSCVGASAVESEISTKAVALRILELVGATPAIH